MSNLEAGCKAFVINDIFVPENNWKVVELIKSTQTYFDESEEKHCFKAPAGFKMLAPSEGFYWMVKGDLVSIMVRAGTKIKDEFRYYKPENLIPLKGDFKLEQQTTKNSLPCVSH